MKKMKAIIQFKTLFNRLCWGLALLLALSTMGCEAARSERKQKNERKDPPAVTVVVEKVAAQETQGRVEVTGTLAPWEEAVVSLEAEGRLIAVPVDLGARVRRGSTLARVSPQEFEFRKVQTEADLAAVESEFKRTKDLTARQLVSQQALDEVRRRLEIARTAAELAQKKLTDTTLISPIEGMVAKRLVNVGEYVRVGTPAFNIVRIMPLKLKADVPERYALEVKVNDAVEVYGESLSAKQVLQGKVVRISPIVAVDSRSFSIEAQIENPEGKINPGTFARASIVTANHRRGLSVPEAAVLTFAGTPRVFVVVDNRAKERIIETEGKFKGRLLVTKGLKEGETVIVAGVDRLSDGQAVTIR
jgi:membrane fusion protein (multidrug efflux system)